MAAIITVTYAAFDPGESTGFALFAATGEVFEMGVVRTREELYGLLERIGEVPNVIIEEYKLFKGKALQQSGSKMEAVRVIGVIESWAHQNSAKVKFQDPSIKKIAEMWSGVKPKGAHSKSHSIDAFNHGYYYLIKNKVLQLELRPE